MRQPLEIAALALLLGATVVPTAAYAEDLDPVLATHVRTRAAINGTGLSLLGGWAVGSMVWGGIGLATTERGTPAWSFHQMNLVWGGIDLAIAGAAGAWIGAQTRFPGDTISILRGGNRLQVLYALNLGLDVGYVVTGALLQNAGVSQSMPVLAGYGPSIALQGAVLLGLDAVLLAANAIHDDALLSSMRERYAELPPRMRRPHLSSRRRLVF